MAPQLPQLTDISNLVGKAKGLVGMSHELFVSPAPYRPCGHLNTSTFFVTSSKVVLPTGVIPATVKVVKGKIASIVEGKQAAAGGLLLDYGDLVVSPGVIDVHAHLNEPGREDWEGISTGTAAAAAGGTTTLVDMPLNSFPCTTDAAKVKEKLTLAQKKSHVNMGAWGGLVPENAHWTNKLDEIINEGALGFKAFLSPSGIDDFPNTSRAHVHASLSELKFKGVPLLVHAELVSDVGEPQGDPRHYPTYMNTRPPLFEQNAIHMLLDTLLNHTPHKWNHGFHLHIAHLADSQSLPLLKVAKRNLPLMVETCPHYLLFASEEIPEGSTIHKCAPPIRSAANREALLEGVMEGTIDLISSDHSPAPPSMKELESGDFLKAWGGISGLQFLLPATWTALRPKGLTLERLAQLLSEQPAKLATLSNRKGSIAVGKDADFVVWDPEAAADTSEAGYLAKHKKSPYLGMELKGQVHATFVHGNLVWSQEHGGLVAEPCGQVVKPGVLRMV